MVSSFNREMQLLNIDCLKLYHSKINKVELVLALIHSPLPNHPGAEPQGSSSTASRGEEDIKIDSIIIIDSIMFNDDCKTDVFVA